MAARQRKYPFKSFWKRVLVGFFDALGELACMPLRFLHKPLDPASVQSILVVRLDHIGDAVMCRPAIRALHKKFPHAAIDLIVDKEIAPLFENSKEIRNVIPVEKSWFNRSATFSQMFSTFWKLVEVLKENYYDLGVEFRGDLRNILLLACAAVRHRVGYGRTGGGFLLHEDVAYDENQHQVLLNLNLLKSFHIVQDNKLLPFEYPPEQAHEFWATTAQGLPTTVLPRVVIHMDAGYPSKRWPFENYKALIQKIDGEAIAQIILIGTEKEREKTADLKVQSERILDMRGKTDLHDLPILFDACDVFIGNDSGPSHIAAAQGLEVILLASGTNDTRFWYPWTERLSLLQYAVPCAPCELPECPVEGHPCMERVTVDQAYDAFQAVLSRLQKKS